jgi:hypothetical protein
MASDAVMKGLENPPCSYSLAFEGVERQTGGKRSRKTKTKSRTTKKRQSGGKSKSRKPKSRKTKKRQSGGKSKSKSRKTKSRKTKKRQSGGKSKYRKSSKKSTKKYKKTHRGGGSDWGHTNYSRVVGVPDAGEASRFKNFTTSEFEAPSQLAKDAGLSSPSNGVFPNDPLDNSYGVVGN